MLRRSPVAAAVALLVTAPLAAQQSVTLRLNAPRGQVTKYMTVVETYMQGGPMAQMGGDPSQPFQRMTMFNTRTLTDIVADTLVFTEVVDSARMETPAMPQAAAMMGQIATQMRGMTTVIRMDRRARIFGTEVTNNPMAGTAGPGRGPGAPGGPGGGRGRGGMGGGNSSRNMVFILPAEPVRPGATWSDSMVIAGETGQPNSTFRATFRFERMDGQVAVVAMNGTMDMPMQGTMTTMTTTGDFRLDLGQNRLGGMTMTLSGTAQTQMGEMPMRMVMTNTVMP
jgi:hypothetical protein